MHASRPRPPLAAALLAALLAAAAGGCSRKDPVTTAPLPPSGEVPPRGTAQVVFIPDPTAPPLELPPGQEILRPAPRLIPAPLYPQDALEAGCGDATIGLRIIVDGEGRVSEVTDSPVLQSAGGSCGRRFREESVRAVSGWIFLPARWRRMEPGEDMDGDGEPEYQVVVASRRISVYLDLRIDFEVVAGEGRVRLRI